MGNYDSCAWSTIGQGQFRPGLESSPFSGTPGTVSVETELKIEMVCQDALVWNVLEELVKSHPYEEPAYHAIKVLTLTDSENQS